MGGALGAIAMYLMSEFYHLHLGRVILKILLVLITFVVGGVLLAMTQFASKRPFLDWLASGDVIVEMLERWPMVLGYFLHGGLGASLAILLTDFTKVENVPMVLRGSLLPSLFAGAVATPMGYFLGIIFSPQYKFTQNVASRTINLAFDTFLYLFIILVFLFYHYGIDKKKTMQEGTSDASSQEVMEAINDISDDNKRT